VLAESLVWLCLIEPLFCSDGNRIEQQIKINKINMIKQINMINKIKQNKKL